MRWFRFAAAAIVIPLAATAPRGSRAQPQPEPAPGPPPPPPVFAEPSPVPAEPPPKPARDVIEPHGRVFVRDSLIRIDDPVGDWNHELDVESLRLALEYTRRKRIKLVVEVDFANAEVELDDGYVELRAISEVRIRAGRFKRPISAIALESAWQLPMVERGLLSDDVETAALDIPLPSGGRSEGVQIELRPDLPLRPRGFIGVFNAELARSRIAGVDAFDPTANRFRDVYGRATIQVREWLELGASGAAYARVRDDTGDLRQGAVAGIDLVVDHDLVRVWLEAYYARTPYVDPAERRVHGGLWAGRLLAAPRFELLDPVLLEPFAYASFVDLSDDIEDSTAFQLGGGASLRLFGRWRAQLEVARVRTGDDYPVAPLTRVFAQVSSAF